MSKAYADEIILSYNDVVLRRSDLDILSGPHFLNDRIIEFYFSHLSLSYPREDILLVSPSIAFWIKECPDINSLKDFLDPLRLSEKKLILFPINDNDDVSFAEGGSHWSLLVFEKNADVFVHHDSSSSMNKKHAIRLYKAVIPYVSFSAKYVECSTTPKQLNGYDCGLYVTAIARVICIWYANCETQVGEDLWFQAMSEQVTSCAVSDMRKEILGLITSLMAAR